MKPGGKQEMRSTLMPPDFPLDPGSGMVYEAKAKPAPHECKTPDAREHIVGSIWCCEACHCLWNLTDDGCYGDYAPSFTSVWRLETKRERRKRWKRGVIYKGELR
jgi:hypothetical protein